MPSENRSQVDLGRCTNLTGMGETWLHFNLHCVDNFLFIYLFPPNPLEMKAWVTVTVGVCAVTLELPCGESKATL